MTGIQDTVSNGTAPTVDSNLNFRLRWTRKTWPVFVLLSALWILISLALWWVAAHYLMPLVLPDQQQEFQVYLLILAFAASFAGMMIMFVASLQIANHMSRSLVRVANGDLSFTTYPVWCPVNSNIALASDAITARIRRQILTLNNLLVEQGAIADRLLKLVQSGEDKTDRKVLVDQVETEIHKMVEVSGQLSRLSAYFRC
ncbi:hypothetical protein [Thiohalophilus sp.]|uniref:hypothetical protein n=1 Tax=Thiohalophilus sp. TaxID=3028392 RepID=UPI002ACDB6A0|nr:hypothetical protein [Thiohalophilus sp.]MDZ7663299.1 hypothetical protein [Thiohalophilus sp.]